MFIIWDINGLIIAFQKIYIYIFSSLGGPHLYCLGASFHSIIVDIVRDILTKIFNDDVL